MPDDSKITRIHELEDRLNIAVDYAQSFRNAIEPELVEACEKATRYANMLSAAIVALKTEQPRMGG